MQHMDRDWHPFVWRTLKLTVRLRGSFLSVNISKIQYFMRAKIFCLINSNPCMPILLILSFVWQDRAAYIYVLVVSVHSPPIEIVRVGWVPSSITNSDVPCILLSANIFWVYFLCLLLQRSQKLLEDYVSTWQAWLLFLHTSCFERGRLAL
jgi:hypothetical protein